MQTLSNARHFLFLRARDAALLKATMKKLVLVPGYTKRDGTVVQPHQKEVHYNPDVLFSDVAKGNGSHSQKKAHAKLSNSHWWQQMSTDDKAIAVMALATDIQDKASASAAVSGWKAAAEAGKNPTQAQWAAFNALPNDKKAALLDGVGSKAGGVQHLKAPALPVEPEKAAEIDLAKRAKEPQPAGSGIPVEHSPVSGTPVEHKATTAFPASSAGVPAAALDMPAFESIQEGVEWAKARAAKLGMTWGAYRTTGEYKDHVYPALAALHSAANEAQAATKPSLPDAPDTVDQSLASPAGQKGAIDALAKMESGPHYQKVAIAKLKQDSDWLDSSPEDQLDQAMDLYHQLQGAASQAAAVSVAKKAMLAGKVPSKAQYLALINADFAVIEKVANAVGQDKYATLMKQAYDNAGEDGKNAVKQLVNKKLAQAKGESQAAALPATKLTAAQKKVAQIDPEQVANWMSADPGKAGDFAGFLEHVSKASSAKFFKWRAASKKFPASWHVSERYISASLCSLFGAHDCVLTKDGLIHPVSSPEASDAEGFVTDPSIVKAAVMASWGAKADDAGPNDGDTKQGADGTLVFKDGRWHKVVDADEHGELPPVYVPVDEPVAVSSEAVAAINQMTLAELKAIVDMPGIPAASNDLIKKKISDLETASPSASAATAVKAKVAPSTKFINTGGGHSKHWSVSVLGDKLKTEWGKIGGPKQSSTKVFASHEKAQQAAAKLQQSKVAKGYEKVATTQSMTWSPADQGQPATAEEKPIPVVLSAPAEELSGGIVSMDGWTQVGGQLGSNPGGSFVDPQGQRWYCKFPKTEDMARVEVLSAKLYAAVGANAQDCKLVMKDGKVAVATKWVDLKKATSSELAKMPGATDFFAADAWLANHDVVGLDYTNIQKGADGQAVRIDAGGSMMFKAQGEKKSFTDKVDALKSMRDPKYAQPHAVFGKMTKAQIEASVAKVAAVSDDEIKSLVDGFGPGTKAEKDALAATLIARKQDMLKQYPGAAKLAVAEEAPVYRIPTPPDFENWKGKGQGLSSKAALNQQNKALAQSMYDLAASNQKAELEGLKFTPIDADGAPTGADKPIASHPSQHIKAYHKDVLMAMVTPYVSPKKAIKVTLAKISSVTKSAVAGFAKVASLKDAVLQIGRYALIGKAAEKNPLLTWKPAVEVSKANGKLSRQALFDASKQAFSALSSVQQQAIKDYTGGGYNAMNSAIMTGGSHNMAYNAMTGVDKASVLLPEGAVLSRKFSFGKDADGQYNSGQHEKDMQKLLAAGEGAVLQEFGIISTSMNPGTWSGNVHLRITVGAGVKGLYVAGNPKGGGGAISKHPGEDEIVFPVGTRFIVTKIHPKHHSFSDKHGSWGASSHNVIEVTVLPNLE